MDSEGESFSFVPRRRPSHLNLQCRSLCQDEGSRRRKRDCDHRCGPTKRRARSSLTRPSSRVRPNCPLISKACGSQSKKPQWLRKIKEVEENTQTMPFASETLPDAGETPTSGLLLHQLPAMNPAACLRFCAASVRRAVNGLLSINTLQECLSIA